MNPYHLVRRRALAAAAASILVPPAIANVSYPSRAVTLVVPFPPGGGSDTLARLLAQDLAARLGSPVVIDNRPGANNLIATDYVARQRPDGYSLLMVSSAFVINPSLQKVASDPLKDFTPIAHLADIPLVLVANTGLPVNSVADVVALLKSKPGKLSYSSFGSGSSGHLAGELFRKLTATDVLHVPYKGTAAALTDLVGGQVELSFATVGAASKLANAGKLKILGVTTSKRIVALPDVPVISETVGGYAAAGWNGLVGPAGMPDSITRLLSDSMNAALSNPEFKAKLRQEGYEPVSGSPAQFATFLKTEQAKWSELVRRIDLKSS